MFPIRDHNPSGRTPYVTYALIITNVLVFAISWPLFDQPARLNAFYYDWAIIPSAVSEGTQVYGLFTSMFLHGGLMHLAGNILFLWIFGDNMEDKMGHFAFAMFYFFCGIGAGLAQVFAAPLSIIPTIGASGAIAGVMGGYLLLFPKARVDVLIIIVVFFKIFPLPAWIMLGLWFALQIFSGVFADTSMGGVAYWAHAGGFGLGVLMTLPLWLRLGGPSFWSRNEGQPPHAEAKYVLSSSIIPRVGRRK